MNATVFNTKNVLEKLVNHYGLSAFLFKILDDVVLQLAGTDKKIELVSYSSYPRVEVKKNVLLVFEDLWRSKTDVIASRIARMANYHDTIAARSCIVVKISRPDASDFLNQHHLMGYANSAFHYALIHKKQVVAVMGFGKGRKMDRLPADKRSFEMIRFATIPFTTVSGGLNKLVNAFCEEYEPGDVMTYIDPLLGETAGFEKAGFSKAGNTKGFTLYIDTKMHMRYFTKPEEDKHIMVFENKGSIKLVKELL